MAFLQKAYGFAGSLIKAAVHGAISGAIAVARGGNFLQGAKWQTSKRKVLGD